MHDTRDQTVLDPKTGKPTKFKVFSIKDRVKQRRNPPVTPPENTPPTPDKK